MKVKIESYYALPCACKIFTINGKDADLDDFVDVYDHDPESAEPYGCGNKYAEGKAITAKVLKKYKITEQQF